MALALAVAVRGVLLLVKRPHIWLLAPPLLAPVLAEVVREGQPLSNLLNIDNLALARERVEAVKAGQLPNKSNLLIVLPKMQAVDEEFLVERRPEKRLSIAGNK